MNEIFLFLFFLSIKKTQEANIDALAEVVGKDKAEKVFLAVRPEGDQDKKGPGLEDSRS